MWCWCWCYCWTASSTQHMCLQVFLIFGFLPSVICLHQRQRAAFRAKQRIHSCKWKIFTSTNGNYAKDFMPEFWFFIFFSHFFPVFGCHLHTIHVLLTFLLLRATFLFGLFVGWLCARKRKNTLNPATSKKNIPHTYTHTRIHTARTTTRTRRRRRKNQKKEIVKVLDDDKNC